ncbi:MAG TPA: hypothetical protein VFQ61_37030 [Polyangiaceae bacterium]|nr:hypothetical protein [Polyangiaceae bacterium]
MANGSNERPPGGPPNTAGGAPNTEEAERLAELLRPSWELGNGEGPPGAPSPPSEAALQTQQTVQTLQPAQTEQAPAEQTPAEHKAAEQAAAEGAAPEPTRQVSSRRTSKQTLLGLQPPPPPGLEAHAPVSVRPAGVPPATHDSAPPPPPPPPPLGPPGAHEAQPTRDKPTMIGMGRPPEPEPQADQWPPLASPEQSGAQALDSPRGGAAYGTASNEAASDFVSPPQLVDPELPGTPNERAEPGSVIEAPSQSFSLAKPYVPKDAPNAPPVVVDASVLEAGTSAAQAEAAERRARARRSSTAKTIPGSMRALTVPLPRRAASAVIDEAELAAIKPRRGKVLATLVGVVALAGIAGVLLVNRDKGAGREAVTSATQSALTGPRAEPNSAPSPTSTGAEIAAGPRDPEPSSGSGADEGPSTHQTDEKDSGDKPSNVNDDQAGPNLASSKQEALPPSTDNVKQGTAPTKEVATITKSTAAKEAASKEGAKKAAAQKRAPSTSQPAKPKPVIIRDTPF